MNINIVFMIQKRHQNHAKNTSQTTPKTLYPFVDIFTHLGKKSGTRNFILLKLYDQWEFGTENFFRN